MSKPLKLLKTDSLIRRPSSPSEGGSITRTSDARVIKRSLVIAGHRTSVSLEDAFWRRLRMIAAERGQSLNSVAATIDASRDGANLSSAIRVFVLEAESARPPGDSRVRLDQ